MFTPRFKWFLRVNSRNEEGIKLTVAEYFPLKWHVKCTKGPWNEVSKNDVLLPAVAAACSTALLPAPCSYVEIQVQGVKLKCSSRCLVVPRTDAGAEPKRLYYTRKRCSCRMLTHKVNVSSRHFCLGGRPETLALCWNSCGANLVPKLEQGLGSAAVYLCVALLWTQKPVVSC